MRIKNDLCKKLCNQTLNKPDCFFDTVAENRTEQTVILYGDGSELSNDKAIKGRAKRKTITNKITPSLVDATKEKSILNACKGIGIPATAKAASIPLMAGFMAAIAKTAAACFVSPSERRM